MARRDAEENEQKILRAFDRLREKDPAVVPSMSDIVRESGLGRATVYRNFPDIGSLVFRHLDASYTAIFTRWRAELGAPSDFEHTTAMIGAFVTEMRQLANRNLSILLNEKCQVSKGYARARSAFRDILSLAILGDRSPTEREAAIIDLIARHGEAEQIACVYEASKSCGTEAEASIIRHLVGLAWER